MNFRHKIPQKQNSSIAILVKEVEPVFIEKNELE